jgi:uncharacterized protein YkwD
MIASLSHKLSLLAVVVLAAIGLNAAMTASNANAASIVDIVRMCDRYGDVPATKLSSAANTLTTWCLINRARKQNGVGYVSINKQLLDAASGHATRSVQGKWWDPDKTHLDGWKLSHMEPGNSAPFDQQVVQRTQAAGYCAGGGSWGVGEITYSGNGAGSTPKAAVNWWMSDPPHRAALLDPQWKQSGAAGVPGSAFPGVGNPAGTYVVDFGHCG